ncbi:unnamed protein product [Eruca vesicaria subsp. sativa]|uniref:Secreted protein n=1 Tax=Eruca vesicaria subsp. sativa TaxID=29727 RepID=A0ABC8J8E7_ERUVS|nr:unnamed protein product [Eruca vesicaria subsp. sativa]
MARIRISPQMFIWPSFSFFVLSRARFKNFFLFIKSVISPLGSFSLLVWPSHCSQFGLLALPHITGGEGTPLMGGNCSPSFAWSIREPISRDAVASKSWHRFHRLRRNENSHP